MLADNGREFGLVKQPCICAPGHPKGEVSNIYLETEAFCGPAALILCQSADMLSMWSFRGTGALAKQAFEQGAGLYF